MSAGQAPENPEGPDRPESPTPLAEILDWLAGRLVAVGHGLLLFGLALAGLMLLLVPLALLGVSLALAVKATNPHARQQLTFAGAGLALLLWLVLGPLFLLWMRSLARLTRRLSGQWCGVPITDPYLPPPWADGSKPGLRRRLRWLLADQATWRDMLWAAVNGCVGWILDIIPAGLLVLGVVGIFAPYAGLSLRLLAIAGAVFGLWASPWLLRGYGVLAKSMLAPTRQAELALRVRQLAQTRTEALDTGAAEIRRIERDLHDGAQARLVAMGMTLDAAGQIMDENPVAARALVFEARDASIRALAELRALVRGIHPPVLADRGLADADPRGQ
jgi:signal transduction histidine kinase